MKANDEKLINRLLNETYGKDSEQSRGPLDNVVNLADYFNQRESYYTNQEKSNQTKKLHFSLQDYGHHRRLIFSGLELDIPKGMGIIKIDSRYEEEIVFAIKDEVFKKIISQILSQEVTHLWLRSDSHGTFIIKDEDSGIRGCKEAA